MALFSGNSGPTDRSLLSIAGHDPSSGAGITADLQTFGAHRLFGTSAITALTVQSTLGVSETQPISAELLQRTLQHLCADLPPAGIKIGMLGSAEIVATVATFLSDYMQQKGSHAGLRMGTPAPVPVVLDPILRSSSGAKLLPVEAIDVLHEKLLPLVSWITPNWSELAALTGQGHLAVQGQPIQTQSQAEAATHELARRHPHLHIVATAGDHPQPTDILRLPSGEIHRFAGEHIETNSTHGTGCAFSSALLALLVLRDSPIEAVRGAKHFVTEAIRHAPTIGHGRGPLNLSWRLS